MYPALACFINFKFLSEKFIYMYELNQSKITNILREISKNLNNSKREEKFETESNCS